MGIISYKMKSFLPISEKKTKKNTYMARKKLLQYFLWTKKAVMEIKGG